jgi:serine/threonine-protein kinase HipA
MVLRHEPDVLLVERFDRVKAGGGWRRKAMVSALTLLELDELMARYASYEQLATIIRHRFLAPREKLKELFGRMFNTDDHARNHAAFWNGKDLSLTPAYDICPENRTGGEATQAMLIMDKARASQIALCLKAAPLFLIGGTEAIQLATHQVRSSICDEAKLSKVDRNFLWRRQFLNPYAFEGAPEAITQLID